MDNCDARMDGRIRLDILIFFLQWKMLLLSSNDIEWSSILLGIFNFYFMNARIFIGRMEWKMMRISVVGHVGAHARRSECERMSGLNGISQIEINV